jgi:hypothetical protein
MTLRPKLAAVASLAAAIALPSSCFSQTVHQDVPPDQCPASGTATSLTGRALNVLKNRALAPSDGQMRRDVTLGAMLAGGDDHNRFSETDGAEITGYVIDVRQGGHPESTNCGNLGTLYTDTHIAVALSPGQPITQAVIVEVTPVWRAAMAKRGVDWRTETLQKTLIGHRVRFRGWLLFDVSHVNEAINTAPNHPADWRKTVWEVHPITSMQVLP